jgi:RNA polymerase sigma-70 factor, ECF subfamily
MKDALGDCVKHLSYKTRKKPMSATQTIQVQREGYTRDRVRKSNARRWKKNLSNGIRTKPLARGKEWRDEWHAVQRALAGDDAALSSLFCKNRLRLYRVAFLLLRNKEDAEDALQDGLLSAYAHLHSFEGRARFSTWLTRIVCNAALMNQRRLRLHRSLSLDEILLNDAQTREAIAVDNRPDPEKVFAQMEVGNAVEDKMKHLSPFLRSAFHLRDIQGLSACEAAKVASVNLSTMKSRAARARRQLASLLMAASVNT